MVIVNMTELFSTMLQRPHWHNVSTKMSDDV